MQFHLLANNQVEIAHVIYLLVSKLHLLSQIAWPNIPYIVFGRLDVKMGQFISTLSLISYIF